MVDPPGELTIRNRGAIRNCFKRRPDSALERRTADSLTIDVDRKSRPATGEILFELRPDLGEEGIGALPSVALRFPRTMTMVFHVDASEATLGSQRLRVPRGEFI